MLASREIKVKLSIAGVANALDSRSGTTIRGQRHQDGISAEVPKPGTFRGSSATERRPWLCRQDSHPQLLLATELPGVRDQNPWMWSLPPPGLALPTHRSQAGWWNLPEGDHLRLLTQ